MRIRSIKPEFWRSEDISRLDWRDRLLFIGLWSYVDDNGVGRDVVKVIAADLFALEDDPRETLATVSRGLQNLSESLLIDRYEVDGRPFLHIRTWDQHQRIDKPNKARYPLPTSANAVPRETLATPSRDTPETLAPGTEEQGNRGTGEQTLPHLTLVDAPPAATTPRRGKPDGPNKQQIDTWFEEWWSIYPRKVEKIAARSAYEKALRQTGGPQPLLDGANQYRDDPTRKAQFTAHPTTWLNKGRWADEPGTPENTATAGPSPWDVK